MWLFRACRLRCGSCGHLYALLINTIGQALKGEIADPMVQIVKHLLILGVIYICGAGAQYAYQRDGKPDAQHLNSIRRDLFDHLQDLPISFFDKHTHGEIMSRFTNDTDIKRGHEPRSDADYVLPRFGCGHIYYDDYFKPAAYDTDSYYACHHALCH